MGEAEKQQQYIYIKKKKNERKFIRIGKHSSQLYVKVGCVEAVV